MSLPEPLLLGYHLYTELDPWEREAEQVSGQGVEEQHPRGPEPP